MQVFKFLDNVTQCFLLMSYSLSHLQINWQQGVINCLLDNGADVNKLTDEGISPLAACHVLFYPPDSFRFVPTCTLQFRWFINVSLV